MQCGKCSQSDPPLIETFDESNNVLGSNATSLRPTLLCRNCILGKIVPAYRLSIKKWNLGLVVAYRNDSQEFCLLFEHTVQEWLTLDKAPFEAYTAHYRHCRPQIREQSYDSPQKNVISFDEFWPTDDASWTMDNNHQSNASTHHGHGQTDSNTYVPAAIDITRRHSPPCDPPVLVDVNNTRHQFPIMSPIPIAATLKNSSHGANGSQNKAAPRHWTEAEDQLLLRAVFQAPLPVRWAHVAALVPNRSGKQCRERYYNHLHTKVKVTDWTPMEDALICRLYKVIGSKWVEISRLVPGRSDNSCKNRWHFLRRHLEKYASSLPTGKEVSSSPSSPIKSRLLAIVRAKGNASDEMEKALAKVLLHMMDAQSLVALPQQDYSFDFGPFIHPQEMTLCIRCGLLASSAQTGPICRTTKWCWACSLTPAVLHHDFLRLEHEIRAGGPERVSMEESERRVKM
ncbi:hypothetical protein MPSEU_000234200 [Mayamaea pseudoterrestris]|nr:hypothetical protein MPSEU_000234200 [Mayamaea pseudoterrestris]